jgi:hypothetical protein
MADGKWQIGSRSLAMQRAAKGIDRFRKSLTLIIQPLAFLLSDVVPISSQETGGNDLKGRPDSDLQVIVKGPICALSGPFGDVEANRIDRSVHL